MVHTKRKNTPAASYPCQIEESVKRERSDILIKEAERVKLSVLSDIVASGEPLPVIFEEKRGDMWFGHSDSYAEVLAASDDDIHGKRLLVKPVSLDGAIIGKII